MYKIIKLNNKEIFGKENYKKWKLVEKYLNKDIPFKVLDVNWEEYIPESYDFWYVLDGVGVDELLYGIKK